MAVDVLKPTAVIIFNFGAMLTVIAINPPQAQSTLTLPAILGRHVTTINNDKN